MQDYWQNLGLNYFFFNDTATSEIYTLSLHDALPISSARLAKSAERCEASRASRARRTASRSEEHTSELQSRLHLVCSLLLEKNRGERVHMHRRHTCLDRAHQISVTLHRQFWVDAALHADLSVPCDVCLLFFKSHVPPRNLLVFPPPPPPG